MSWLSVENLRKTFEENVTALDDISFSMKKGEFFCIVGPTNAGKSTLLKIIAGLYRPDSGQVNLSNVNVTALQPKDRQVSLLFQNIALFPTLTGFDNIAFPLRTAGMGETEIAERVEKVAEILKVSHILSRYPRTFSGGEQQRVAIGRAIAYRSHVLMLDEPLTNLDARIRIALRIEFKKLHHDTGQSMLYVTHDQVEAMSLSDRIAVLHEGKFQQIGTPDEIYHKPANRFVAQFMGQPPMNIMDGEIATSDDKTRILGDGFDVPVNNIQQLNQASSIPRAVSFGIRPETIDASPEQTENTSIPGKVVWIERLGAKHVLDVQLGKSLIKVVVRPDHPVQSEGPAWFGFTPRPEHLLDRESGVFFS
ncbi:MAG: ABC transporter ATP-binding protein [Alphaproteobacteria bacterium]